MRVLVCGGRDYKDRERMFQILDALSDVDCIIEGGARGADSLAGEWADARSVALEVYPADWNVHGKSAGHIRNQQMLDEGKPDLVIAFPGGRGTANMVLRAEQACVRVALVE